MHAAHPPTPDPLAIEHLVSLRERLIELMHAALAVEHVAEDEIALVHPDRRISARNLVDYLALREQDIRDLQRELYEVGLTSLGVTANSIADAPRFQCSSGSPRNGRHELAPDVGK